MDVFPPDANTIPRAKSSRNYCERTAWAFTGLQLKLPGSAEEGWASRDAGRGCVGQELICLSNTTPPRAEQGCFAASFLIAQPSPARLRRGVWSDACLEAFLPTAEPGGGAFDCFP